MKCPVCGRELVADIYTGVRKKNGTVVKIYFCERCLKVYEVKYDKDGVHSMLHQGVKSNA